MPTNKEKKKTRTTRRLPQKGGAVKDIFLDKNIIALLPGRRETAHGTVYWESRFNRSDKDPNIGL